MAEIVLLASLAVCGILGWLYWRTWQERNDLNIRVAQLERQNQETQAGFDENKRLQTVIMEVLNDSLLIIEGDQQRIIHANLPAKALLGSNVVGETLIAATRSYDLDNLVQETRKQPGDIPEELMELNHRTIRARALAVPLAQKPTYVIFLKDESELHRLGRARREMVANISHELRTPITTIGLLADTLLSGALKKSKRSEKLVEQIRHSVDDLSQLVAEMRDLSKIESGQMPIKLMPTDLQSLIDNSIDPLRPQAERKGQVLEVRVPENLSVLVDARQIERVLKNIVHNGIKFAPENGFLQIYCEIKADEVTIISTNDGPHIPADDLPRIFERFFQVDRARSDGTGLGLAIARHIIMAHGGRIWAENMPGKGVRFCFTLRLASHSNSS